MCWIWAHWFRQYKYEFFPWYWEAKWRIFECSHGQAYGTCINMLHMFPTHFLHLKFFCWLLKLCLSIGRLIKGINISFAVVWLVCTFARVWWVNIWLRSMFFSKTLKVVAACIWIRSCQRKTLSLKLSRWWIDNVKITTHFI